MCEITVRKVKHFALTFLELLFIFVFLLLFFFHRLFFLSGTFLSEMVGGGHYVAG